MDLSKIALDLTRVVDGTWVQIDDVTSIKVARTNNPNYSKMLQKGLTPYAGKHKTPPEGAMDDLLTKCLVETVLMDWKGLTIDGVSEVPYSKEKAYELLSDRSLVEFREAVVGAASDADNFRKQEIDRSGEA